MLKRGYVVDCTDLDAAAKELQAAAFLGTDGEGHVEMDVSPEFATLDVMGGRKKRKIPVVICVGREEVGMVLWNCSCGFGNCRKVERKRRMSMSRMDILLPKMYPR
jgi:hypothetical protein